MSADRPPPRPSVVTPLPAPVAALVPIEHDALPAGTRFGEFEILRVLGVGGFGIVYLARDHSLERQVALKEYMPAALAMRGAGHRVSVRSGSFAETYAMGLRSFVNEARLLARFDHPSLVKVYRFWEDNGTAYMVMPYLDGRTLRDVRRSMDFAPAEAWVRGVLSPVLDALELLHREGVFHRDVAPDNILLSRDGTPILLDFGAARQVIAGRAHSLTAILKPSYAPIEQYAEMASMRQGPWTDLYALGAVLHFLLLGVPPVPAPGRALEPDADPIARREIPGVSAHFIAVIGWMLAVRPIERPQSVAALRAVLDGEAPVPVGVRHDATVPGYRRAATDTATPPPAVPAATEVPPSTGLPGVGSGPAAEARPDDGAHPPTVPMLRRVPPATTPGVASPQAGPAVDFLPPGDPPTVAGAPLPGPPAAEPVPRARRFRRGWAIGAGLAALALAAGVFGRLAGGADPRPAPPPAPLAAASAPSPAPADPKISAAPVSTVLPVAATLADSPAAASGPPAPAATVVGAGPGVVASPEGSVKPARPRVAASRPPARVAAGPTSAGEVCGDRNFISRAICMDRECERPRFRRNAECVRVLQVKRLRADR